MIEKILEVAIIYSVVIKLLVDLIKRIFIGFNYELKEFVNPYYVACFIGGLAGWVFNQDTTLPLHYDILAGLLAGGFFSSLVIHDALEVVRKIKKILGDFK